MSEHDGRADGGHVYEDHAPGDEPEESAGHWVRTYLIGLGFAVVLTIASFWAAATHLIWGPAVPAALVTLAIAQMGVHLVFFLHITTGPDNTNNVLALAYGLLVVFLLIAGSVWIMANLQQNMMPMTAASPAAPSMSMQP
jgi:cytochrome o ubiquinol oxidase operon protein cyoD